MSTNYPGIDYGLGQTNVDRVTGIRFGVISMYELNEWAHESFEADYGEPCCPDCGQEASSYDDEAHGEFHCAKYECAEYACENCEEAFGCESAFGEEALSFYLDDGEYKASQSGDDCDVFVLQSPYYTHAQFCSPCAPGAGHLGNPCPSGPKTYCFGHDWFEGGIAPYHVYDLKTGKLVEPS